MRANIDRCQIWQASRITKTIVTIESTILTLCSVQNFIKIEAFAITRPKLSKLWPNRWQVSILIGVKNFKKLLSPLNLLPWICAEYQISSNLKHLPLVVQNYGLKDDRCWHWQVSSITENYCHEWIQHLTIVHYAKFRGKWLAPLPVPLFKDSLF